MVLLLLRLLQLTASVPDVDWMPSRRRLLAIQRGVSKLGADE
jgi:hypothetical protein